MNKITQHRLLLELLKDWVSPADAFLDIGTMKLSTRVGELRRLVYEIEDRWVSTLNRYGNKITYKEYKLKEE